MAKTLTITIENIDDFTMQMAWAAAKHMAHKDVGIPVEETDHIKVNYEVARNMKDKIIAELISGAITCHLMMTAHNLFNDKTKT